MANVNQGIFVATTDNYDLTRLEGKDLGSQEFKQFMIKLMQRTNNIALALNLKDSGVYEKEEFVNGQTFFPNPLLSSTSGQPPEPRQVFRMVLSIGELPNASTKTVPHGIDITDKFTFTRIYGSASSTASLLYIPIPFVDVSGTILAGNIELTADQTNVYVTTTGDGTEFDYCYIVLEYLRN